MPGKVPNILLLFTDQQRYDTINACGYPHMKTPNLDRIVGEGCCFRNAYSPNPVCIPARHNLLTGLPARYHGYSTNMHHPVPHVLPTLPRILADGGYDTRAIGKMHFRPVRRHNGFNKMELMEEIPHFREDDEYAMYLKKVGFGNVQNIHGVRNLLYHLPQQSLIPEEHHGSTWIADRSIDYIKANAGKRPFFLWSSWIAPHPPFDVPESFAGLYKNSDIPEAFQSKTDIPPRGKWVAKKIADFPKEKENDYLRRIRELYYAAISMVDKNVGRILDALEETGELDNTLVIFTSDHGEMLGDHGCYQKQLLYDSCTKIPLLMRFPEKIKAATVREDFADLNDILPSVLDAAKIDYPGPYELPGASVFNDNDSKDRRFQYIENFHYAHRCISLRDRKYKYNYYYGGGREELFDMQNDPCESVNLLETEFEKYSEERKYLRKQLVRYEKKWGLENYVDSGNFIRFEPPMYPEPGRCSQFPVFPGNLDDDEKAVMNDFGDEVIEAVKNEPLVKLHELDLECWQKNGAPAELAKKIRKMKL